MKRVLNKILAGTLLACLAFNTTHVYANSMETEKSTLIEEKTNEIKGICDEEMTITGTEKFDIIPNGSYYYTIPLGRNSGRGTITFEERAECFKLICTEIDVHSGKEKEIFSETYLFGGPKDKNGDEQGIKSITFEMKMNGKSNYRIKVENEDSVIISGDIKLRY